jgi:hypothetical protein
MGVNSGAGSGVDWSMWKLWIALVLTAAVAGIASAADVTGKWTGKVEFKTPDGNTDTGGALVIMKQSGEEITGTAGESDEHMAAIENGKIAGTKVTFQVTVGEDKRVFKLSMDLVSEDKLEGDIEGVSDQGEKLAGKISLTREKS